MENTISIKDALLASTQLKSDTPRLDVECLLCHVLTCESTYLRTWPDKMLTSEQYAHFERLLTRRLFGEPIAHICGTRSFWTLDLLVTPDTLIPRPDTEILVEQILALELPEQATVLDLGTGLGPGIRYKKVRSLFLVLLLAAFPFDCSPLPYSFSSVSSSFSFGVRRQP